MDTLEEVPAIEDTRSEAVDRFDVFVRAYVSEFEKKLEEYAKEANVGGTAKSGKVTNTLGPPLGTAASAGAGLVGGVVGLVGKAIGGKAIETGSKYFSGKDHRKRAKKITRIFQTMKPDELRKMFVEGASLIYYSFQSQFDSVTDADGNWKRGLRKLAIDARNRTISYLHNEATETLSKDLLTKALILGESKDSFISHVTPKKMQQIIPGTKPGHTLKNASNEWKTSDIYEKVGMKIVGSNGQTKYYKKEKCGNDYGYRWAFSWENDSFWMSNYREEDCGNVSEDPRTQLNLEELEAKTVQILANINKEDPKLQLERIEGGVDETKETLETMKKVIEDIAPIKQELYEIKTKFSSGLPNYDQPKIFTVKEPVKTFTGRERELTQLHDKLQTHQNQVVVSQCASISGLGGMGKSELARKYAHTYHESYGSCIWIDSETQSSITQSFHRLACELKILKKHADPGGVKSIEKDIPFILTQIYKCFSNTKTLFIFDNVNEYEEIKEFLPSNLSPTDEKPTIIITSRNSDWDIGDEGDVGLILLDQFTPEEALSFAKKVLEIEDEDKSHDPSISELTKELSCFPLALRQAASYIKAKKCLNSAIETYLSEFRDEKKKRDLLKYKTKRDRYTETTYTTWQVTFRNMEKDEASGHLAIRLVEIMAYLRPDVIFLEPFIKLAENGENLNEAVDILVKYSIINVKEEYDERSNARGNAANIHRLVQQVIRFWIQDQEREEDVLRTALTQIDDYLNPHHLAALFTFACDYTTLINNYFCKLCEGTKRYDQPAFAIKYLVEDGDVRTTQKILNYLEGRNDLWREISWYMLHKPEVMFNHNDRKMLYGNGIPMKYTGHDVKVSVLFHVEVNKALKHSNTRDLELFLQSFDKSLIDSFFGGITALYKSADTGNLNVVKILIENGANVNLSTNYHITAAQVALAQNHPQVAEYLLEQGANPNITDFRCWTLLESACYYGHLNIVKQLVDEKAIWGNDGTEAYLRPFLFAARYDKIEIVKFLINHEVYRNAMKDHGQTLCSIAAKHGSTQVVKYLIDKKLANVNGRRSKNKILLMTAIDNDQFGIVKYLLSDETPDKVNIDAYDVLGRTPLFQAVSRGIFQIVRILIEHGAADDNVQNRNTLFGQLNISALHLAAIYDCLEIVTLLIEECNADINMGLNTTFSPLQVAKYFDSKEVCEFLIRNGADNSEWCEENLENITCVFRSFCKENEKADIVPMLEKCYLVLFYLKMNYRYYRNYSEDVEKRFRILFSYFQNRVLVPAQIPLHPHNQWANFY